MTAAVSVLGIRHHGPGSARRLRDALDELAPATVLIEGPADGTPLLPLLAHPDMRPPVAMLLYSDDAVTTTFFPFAEHSPEYQAVLWAVGHGAELRFIDLPAADLLAARRLGAGEDADPEAAGEDGARESGDSADDVVTDPIGALARAAGYDDGESWWSDVIEENPAPGPVFDAVAVAMAALRSDAPPPSGDEAAREAHMRLEIARAAAESPGPVAVVCGAWHLPALVGASATAADRATLRGRPKAKVAMTWVPWTMPRLARDSGYGAGVVAPGWTDHLWNSGDDPDRDSRWLARIAAALRDRGHTVSTASLIEAQRLGRALAALRERPAPGFEELRDAAISVLCFGEPTLWRDIAPDLLLGSAVGSIPEGVPLAPLLDDLHRQQRATRLKPEALDRELALDLRSDSGLARSILLHRLTVLDVPWGVLADAGRSRGTFRERWTLRWEPELAVRLVDNAIHGSTIADAAGVRVVEGMRSASALPRLAELVREALVADLVPAAESGVELIARRVAQTSECGELLGAIPPLVDIVRYGEARPTTGAHLAALVPRLVVQASIALPYAARGLDDESAGVLRGAVLAAHVAITLGELAGDERDRWLRALLAVADDVRGTPLVVGTAARLLYEAGELSADRVVTVLGRMLSPGTPVAQAAGFFEGFFDGAGQRLIHDGVLREGVDAWLVGLGEEDFTAHLPLFRRVFSALDATERRRLLDALFAGSRPGGAPGYREVPEGVAAWAAHEERVAGLLRAGARR